MTETEEKVLEEFGTLIRQKDVNVALTESATAGRIMAAFSLLEKAGQFLKGGLVCYDAGVKEDILKVPHDLVEKYTPESAEVTEAAAKGLRNFLNADIHVAVTGLTAPGGSETEEKPVGTVFTHILFRDKSLADRTVFEGSPETIMEKTTVRVAQLLMELLKSS